MKFAKTERLVVCVAMMACLAVSVGCSRSKPTDESKRPVATVEEVNQALTNWYMFKAAYPTNLNELEASPFLKKRLPTAPPGQKLILQNGRAVFVPE